MARLLADLRPILQFFRGDKPQKEILRQCLSLEMAGADGVLVDTGENYEPSRGRLLDTISRTLNIGLTVRTIVDEKWVESLQEIKPSMVIFNYDDARAEEISGFVTRLQVEDILIGLSISGDLDSVKKAAKLKADYFILDCSRYCETSSLSKEVEELNRIVKLSSLGKKLSMGMLASGDFNKRKLRRLNDTGAIEEFILGVNFFSESLLFGYGTAVDRIRSSLI